MMPRFFVFELIDINWAILCKTVFKAIDQILVQMGEILLKTLPSEYLFPIYHRQQHFCFVYLHRWNRKKIL